MVTNFFDHSSRQMVYRAINFFEDYSVVSIVQRKQLPVEGAFEVEGLLTQEECEQYILAAEKAGFSSLISEFPSQYRSNDRVMTLVPGDVERTIFARLLPALHLSGKSLFLLYM